MKIAVYCSSSKNIAEEYKDFAFQLGEMLAAEGHTLVYGGATGGLMDSIAEGFASENAEIIGVITEAIIQMGRESKLPTQMIRTANMSERKEHMREEADVFVVLPGGYGTWDEMFDVVASGTVGEHKKPLICINAFGYYNDLMAQIEKMSTLAFAPKHQSYKAHFVETAEACVELISSNFSSK